MANVAPGIVTFGLGGNQNAMILGFPFNMGTFILTVPPPITGGGTHAIPIKFDLTDEDDYPPEQKIRIEVKIRFGQIWRERVYWMFPKNVNMMIKVLNLINTTKTKFKFIINNIRRKVKTTAITISNIMNKNNTNSDE